jgi:hypothetical protein
MERKDHYHICVSCGFDWDHNDPECDLGDHCDCEDCLVEQVYWVEETFTTFGFCPPEDPDREPNPMERRLLIIGGFKNMHEMDQHYGASAASLGQRSGFLGIPDADRLRPSEGAEGTDTLRSTEGATAAVEFLADLKELNKAVKYLFAGKSGSTQARVDYVDLNAFASQIEMVIPGASSAFAAEIKASGYARLPLPVFERIERVIRRLHDDSINVSIVTGSIKMGTVVFSHPEISLRLMGKRIADLPIDAPLPDVLALVARFRPEEIEDSGLLARVLAAQERASKLIDQAFMSLAQLGIERGALGAFVSEQITARARQKR